MKNLWYKYTDEETKEVIHERFWTSQCQTGVRGLVTTLRSILLICNDYVRNGDLEYLCTYKMSQDHLETFFSCVRSMGGYNRNPNAIQFKASYKRLLMISEVRASENGNCEPDDTSILWVSSRGEGKLIEKEVLPPSPAKIEKDLSDPSKKVLMNIVTYIAGFVERVAEEKVLQKCQDCKEKFNNLPRTHCKLTSNKTLGFLRNPTEYVNSICMCAETIIRKYEMGPNLYQTIQNKFYEQFTISNFEHDDCSKMFVDKCFDIYVNARMRHIEQTSKPENNLRQRLTRLIHHMGQ